MAGMFSQSNFDSNFAAGLAIRQMQAQSSQTQANAAMLGAQGTSSVNFANAGQVAANAAAMRALQGAQGGQLGSEANLNNANALEVAKNAASLRAAQAAAAFRDDASSDSILYNTDFTRRKNVAVGNDAGDANGVSVQQSANREGAGPPIGSEYDPNQPTTVSHARGMVRVPGKGDGKTDKVKAILAPGEAVLNKGAADHLGRGGIAALNAIGRAKMGMVNPMAETA